MSLRNSLHLMVVDDMATSRGLITNALDEMEVSNYRVENDGASALSSLVAHPVHLVLSDYNMPNMDGLHLLKALRETRATARIGFILITGRATPELVRQGQLLGVNNIVKKPFTTASLKGAIEKVVGRL